jgi:signal peptidase II
MIPPNMPPLPPSRWITFVTIAVLGCALDLGSKSWIFGWLGPPGGETYWLIKDYFGLQTSLNEGALFGIGQGKVFVFALMSISAAIGIPVWLFWFRAAIDGWLNTALAFIMAGILGNLYDRLGLWWTEDLTRFPRYAVRDWILWQFQQWTWPNFNLADSFLVTGACMILIQAILPPKLIDNGPSSSS